MVKSERYRFGLFDFDPENLQLRRQGLIVELQSQPSRVLAFLIQNANRRVSREELRNAIWGEEIFVDFDRGLNFCISQIRSALGDDPARPIYIRTFHKQGYQFIAPVESTDRNSGAQQDKTPPRELRSKSRQVLVAALAAATLALVILSAFWFRSSAYFKRLPIIAVVRFDNETGRPELTRFSDGLTDNLVERLTIVGGGRFHVIGNDRMLRLPRDQRDLNAIGATSR